MDGSRAWLSHPPQNKNEKKKNLNEDDEVLVVGWLVLQKRGRGGVGIFALLPNRDQIKTANQLRYS